jgi:hypothetical protein
MNYATYAALTEYATPAAALAAKPTNGQAWLLNETKIFKDGRMAGSGPASLKTARDVKYAGSQANLTIQRNKGNKAGVKTTAIAGGILGTAANYTYPTSTGGDKLSTKGASTTTVPVNKEYASNAKTPMIRHKVAWYVTDSNAPGGYRRVFGLLEDAASSSPYRDDDAQVRK